jgi:AAA15 family ATPase/GTPase
MTERLIIQDFAGIKSINIEVKQFNILIGPQASGKSICAKLLFYFKNFATEIVSSLEQKEYGKRHIDAKYKLLFLEYFPPISWGGKSFSIRYENRYENMDSFIEIRPLKMKGIRLDYSDNYKQLISTLKKFDVEVSYENASLSEIEKELVRQRSNLLELVLSYLGETSLDSQIFIPAGRSIFAIVQRSIFSFLAQKDELDPFLISFGSLYQLIKKMQVHRLQDKSNIYMEKLAEEIVCGKYVERSNEDFIEMYDGRLVNLASSSSGQQETLPLTMILTSLSSFRRISDRKTVYIEEPEAHIFPSAQRKLIQLIAAAFNQNPGETQFFITTHSPYVLTAVNNLLQAGELYESNLNESNLKKLMNIIPKSIALHFKDISVYSIERKGAKSILCEETGLIDASIIDEVSNDLSIEFGQLLDLIN